ERHHLVAAGDQPAGAVGRHRARRAGDDERTRRRVELGAALLEREAAARAGRHAAGATSLAESGVARAVPHLEAPLPGGEADPVARGRRRARAVLDRLAPGGRRGSTAVRTEPAALAEGLVAHQTDRVPDRAAVVGPPGAHRP